MILVRVIDYLLTTPHSDPICRMQSVASSTKMTCEVWADVSWRTLKTMPRVKAELYIRFRQILEVNVRVEYLGTQMGIVKLR